MATFVNTKIIISKPIKQKSFGFYITIRKKDVNNLTIKAHDYKGRDKGIAGKIDRLGYISFNKRLMKMVQPLINTKEVRGKIDLTLDLVYGVDRTKVCTVEDNGMPKFHPTIMLIDKPKNKKAR